MSSISKPYSVRVWDAFYNTWVMIPETGLSRSEAVNRAIELSEDYDCGENGTQEVQVWIDCPMVNTAQMVGYTEPDVYETENGVVYDGFGFVESFS